MTTSPTQNPPHYPPGHAPSQTQHHAWRTAPNSAPHLLAHLPRLLEQQHPARPLQLLDVGAGPGTLSASLATHLRPSGGTVTATDISPDVLARAAAHAAAQGVANMAFREASVYALPFADGEFDVVHAHQVLCHLDRPVAAVREMLRVCRPGGGVVALREADMRMWCFWPEGSGGGLERFRKLMGDVLVANGGQEMAGRRLVEWVMAAGVPREGIEAGFGTWYFSEPGDRRVWGEAMIERLRTGQMRSKGLEMGIVTEEGIEEMIKAWEEWIETADATLGIMNGEVIVTKA